MNVHTTQQPSHRRTALCICTAAPPGISMPPSIQAGGLGFCWVLGDVRCWDEIYGNLLEKKVWFIAGKIIEVNLGRFPATFENTGGDVGKILGAKVEI